MTTPTSKRTTSPAFQFYPNEFLGSSKVDRMSMTERGVYITLLSRCWQDNGLPADIASLAKFARMRPQQFERMWTSGPLHECFYEKNGRLFNERMEKERRKQADYRKTQKDRADKRWQSRGNAVAMQEERRPVSARQCSPIPSPSPIPISSPKRDQYDVAAQNLDVAFRAFQSLYPASRRKGGLLMEQAYLGACGKAGGPQPLEDALRSHIDSEQWSNPKLIPGMDTWLNEERWRQTLPAKGDDAKAISQAVSDPVSAWLREKAVGS